MADTFKVERSTTIAAAPETVFSFIDDFRQWTHWSPWEKLDADLERTYSGAESGVGARYGWNGKKAGAGTMEIVTADPGALVAIDLRFTKPFKAENPTRFVLTPEGSGTRVIWTMTGQHNLMSKLMGLFMSMDKMVGKDFESGLAALKTASEAKAGA